MKIEYTPTRIKVDTEMVAKMFITEIDKFCQYTLQIRECKIESDMPDSDIGFEIVCQLFIESGEDREVNASWIISQHLYINRLNFFFDGTEIEVEQADAIYEAIQKNYLK